MQTGASISVQLHVSSDEVVTGAALRTGFDCPTKLSAIPESVPLKIRANIAQSVVTYELFFAARSFVLRIVCSPPVNARADAPPGIDQRIVQQVQQIAQRSADPNQPEQAPPARSWLSEVRFSPLHMS